MIDLDSMENLLASYEVDSSLYLTIGSWLCEDKITYTEFQKLAKWLGIYVFILPRVQDLFPDISDYLYKKNRYNLFNLALLVSHLRAHYTLEQQLLLLNILESRRGD